MKNGILILALIALTGCASTREWTKRHPIATAIIATSILITAGAIAEKAAERDNRRVEMDKSVPLIDCTKDPGVCR